MNNKADIQIHFISEENDEYIARKFTCHVPRPGEEVRFGGEGKEKYYTITRVVWVYDEDGPFDRVNIGVTLAD